MNDHAVIYHNPRCSKSRAALELLRSRGVEPRIVEYLKEPPLASELERLVEMLGVEPHGILRTKEDAYRAEGLAPSSSMNEVAAAIAREPVLLERPIVVIGGRAAIGRPPENVLALLE
jgi:arsenate reductase